MILVKDITLHFGDRTLLDNVSFAVRHGEKVALIGPNGEIAALWKFAKLIEHWKRKHNRAVYVASLSSIEEQRFYKYGPVVKLCTGTDFLNVLRSIELSKVYYDPGIKLENASTAPRMKRRSQFRIKSCDIDSLYTTVELVDLS